MQLKSKRQLAKILSSWLPPIVSQRVRNLLYSEKDGISESAVFIKKSITGSYFTGNTQDIHAYPFSVHGFYEWRNIAIAKALCKNRGEIIEIGANIGTETVSFSDIVGKQGKVYAFEPLESNLKWLKNNSTLCKYSNIKIFSSAISDTNGFIEFIPPSDSHMTGIGSINLTGTKHVNTIKVQTRKLDDFINEFQNICCIFTDIEGADLLAISGAHKVINRFRPIIVIEYSPKLMKNFGYGQDEITDKMNRLNYRCFKIGKLGIKKIKTNETKKSNWICFPVEKSQLVLKTSLSVCLSALLPTSLFNIRINDLFNKYDQK